MKHLNALIHRNFGVILLFSAITGLFLPSGEYNTSVIIIISLAAIIFVSYFMIEFDSSFFRSDWKSILLFFVFRFIALPVLCYYTFLHLNSFYATAFFLLLLLPSAVSSPAFAAMFGGKISLTLKTLVLSSFVTILSIPLLSGLILARSIDIDSKHMFLVMIYTVIIPFITHLPVRRYKNIVSKINLNNPLITAIGLILIFVVSTSKNRAIILENPQKMLVYAGIAIIFYIVLYFIGFYSSVMLDRRRQVSFSVSSGANNIGMGVTLTILFFPGETNVFFIVSQLAWIFVLIPMRYFYKKKLLVQ